jgi:hypothetical protein
VLSVGEKMDYVPTKNNIPVQASNYFSLLFDKNNSSRSVGDIMCEEGKDSIYRQPYFKACW